MEATHTADPPYPFPLVKGVTAVLKNGNFEVVPVDSNAPFELASRPKSNPQELWAIKCVHNGAAFTPQELDAVLSAGSKMGLQKAMVVSDSEFSDEVKAHAKNRPVNLIGKASYRQTIDGLPETALRELKGAIPAPAFDDSSDPAHHSLASLSPAPPAPSSPAPSPQIKREPLPAPVSTNDKKRFPLWAKILIGLVGAFLAFVVFSILVAILIPNVESKPTGARTTSVNDSGELLGLKYRTFKNDFLPVEQEFYAALWQLDRIPNHSEFKPLADALLDRGHHYMDPLVLPNLDEVFDSLSEQTQSYPYLAYAALPSMPEDSWYPVSKELLRNDALTSDPIIKFHLWALHAASTHGMKDYDEAFDSLKFLLDETEGLSNMNPINAYNVLKYGHPRAIRKTHRARIIEILKVHPNVPEWLKGLEIGTWHLNQSNHFESREEMASEEFANHLRIARTHLTQSWQLQPNMPDAASFMISISTHEGQSFQDRTLWFERAIESQVDFQDAWLRYQISLRPYWGGYDETLAAYCKMCIAKSGELPRINHFFKTCHIERSKRKKPSKRRYWTDLSESEKSDFMTWESRINSHHQENYSFAATLWYVTGQYDRMMKSLKRINFRLDRDVLALFEVDPVEMEYQVNQLK